MTIVNRKKINKNKLKLFETSKTSPLKNMLKGLMDEIENIKAKNTQREDIEFKLKAPYSVEIILSLSNNFFEWIIFLSMLAHIPQ
jgi:hypothetical protein